MTRGRWFLPEVPDVIGLLRDQLRVTIEGLDAFARWAGGEEAAAAETRAAEEQGDVAKRALLEAIRGSLVMPLEPEDLFTLSRDIDSILNHASDLVGEAEAMQCPPDSWLAEMAAVLCEAVRELDAAVADLVSDGDSATASANEAIHSGRRLQGVYYGAMAASLELPMQRERIARRELYRGCSRIGDEVMGVGERVVYAVVKKI